MPSPPRLLTGHLPSVAAACRHVLVLCGVMLAGGLVSAAPMHPLVRQLGDPRFIRRMEAEQELLEQGTSALELLEEGLQSSDREVRQRSQRLSELLRKSSLLLQLKRVEQNPWVVPAKLAPAWEAFQSIAGDGEAARNLYVRMIDQEGELLLSVELRPENWMEQFERRCADLRIHFMDRRIAQDLHPLTVLTALFLAEHPDNKPNLTASQTVTNLLIDPVFYNFIQSCSVEEAKVCRSLLSEWVIRKGHVTPQTRLELSSRYQLPAGVVAAREIIANRHAVGASRTQLHHAIRFIAVHEPMSALQDLEPLLNLRQISLSPMEPNQILKPGAGETAVAPEAQTSNLALLGLVQLTEQDPQAYGFANVRIDQDHRYNTSVPLITSDKDRREALLKWYAWRTAHPLWFRSPSPDASLGHEI